MQHLYSTTSHIP